MLPATPPSREETGEKQEKLPPPGKEPTLEQHQEVKVKKTLKPWETENVKKGPILSSTSSQGAVKKRKFVQK